MIDHVVLNVRDYAASKRFYVEALQPLGHDVVLEFRQMAGLGREGKPELWIGERNEPSAHVHVALASPDRRTVDEFYNAALAAGGCPRSRLNNLEAVCHRPG
jgi:catechol 2,3-dioxygenase-like lactoylglutathione lyase family enzyme